LFVLSILAIVPLAGLSEPGRRSPSPQRTGDAIGGLSTRPLGNLTELVISLAALRAGQYSLVRPPRRHHRVVLAVHARHVFFLGGLKHSVQEFSRPTPGCRRASLLLATVGLLVPSAVAGASLKHDLLHRHN